MDDYALVLNAGSSSLKFCVFRETDGRELAARGAGQIEGIGTSPRLSATQRRRRAACPTTTSTPRLRDSRSALMRSPSWLRSNYTRRPHPRRRASRGARRPRFTGPTIVTPQVLADLHDLMPLAPLHQPHNLAAIDAVSERLPERAQVACFDTSFHRGQSPVAEFVPLPRDIARSGVQRYGFHGLSYEYIASVLPEIAPEIADGRVIVAHLGSGASLCAMKNRKSVDSTLGFTALDGLCMGTRPGRSTPASSCISFRTSG